MFKFMDMGLLEHINDMLFRDWNLPAVTGTVEELEKIYNACDTPQAIRNDILSIWLNYQYDLECDILLLEVIL